MRCTHLLSINTLLLNRTQCDRMALDEHEGYFLLCQRLMEVAQHIHNCPLLISCLKTLFICQENVESPVTITLLTLLEAKVKELSLQQIISLSFLLKDVSSSSHINTIKMALPQQFEKQLETQLLRYDMSLMCDALKFACVNRLSPSKIQYIADALLASDTSFWPTHHVFSLLRSIETIPNVKKNGLEPLLQASLKCLAVLVKQCKQEDLLLAMTATQKSFSSLNRSWYNQELCEKVAQRVIREKWPLKSTATISCAFSAFPFLHVQFLEYFSSLIVNNQSAASLMDPSYLLLPFSSTIYKPRNFQAMIKVLLSSPRLKISLSVRNLFIFDYFNI